MLLAAPTGSESQVNMRIVAEGPFLPLDGLLSQAGDVFFKFENLDVRVLLFISLPFSVSCSFFRLLWSLM